MRRTDPHRRDGHEPPVIAEASGPTEAIVLEALYETAASNVEVARRLIQWSAGGRAHNAAARTAASTSQSMGRA